MAGSEVVSHGDYDGRREEEAESRRLAVDPGWAKSQDGTVCRRQRGRCAGSESGARALPGHPFEEGHGLSPTSEALSGLGGVGSAGTGARVEPVARISFLSRLAWRLEQPLVLACESYPSGQNRMISNGNFRPTHREFLKKP